MTRRRRRPARVAALGAAAAIAVTLLILIGVVASRGGSGRVAPPPAVALTTAAPAQPTSVAAPTTTPARPRPRRADPGSLPQTTMLPTSTSAAFTARMATLWRGVVADLPAVAMPAIFPRRAYVRMKTMRIPDPLGDYESRLVAQFGEDIHAAHLLLGAGAGRAELVGVRVAPQWTWIVPGACENGIGYWHDPGSRLVYREAGQVRSFGIFSMISWRGEWYVVHFAVNGSPGTVDQPSSGVGVFGAPGGC